jgi:hypothetical protein
VVLAETGAGRDVAVTVDGQGLGARTTDDVEGVSGAGQQDRFGQDLGHPALGRHHRGQVQVGVGRQAGLRVDEVMAYLAAGLPPPPQGGGSGDGAIGHAEQHERLERPRMLERNRPSIFPWPHSRDPDISTQVDADPVGPGCEQFGADHVGGQASTARLISTIVCPDTVTKLPAWRLSSLISLSSRNRLHRRSRSSITATARSRRRPPPPTTITWASLPIARHIRSAAMARRARRG